MKSNKKDIIVGVLSQLKEKNIEYALLRGSSKFMEREIEDWKDIDILINPEKKNEADRVFKRNGFIIDPRFNRKTYLYGVNTFKYYRNFKWKISFDVSYQLTCESLNNGEICPLHKEIQLKAFKNYYKTDGVIISLPEVVKEVYELSYCIFNKGCDEKKLNALAEIIRVKDNKWKKNLSDMMYLIFYRFTDVLLCKIENNDLSNLRKTYLRFKDY